MEAASQVAAVAPEGQGQGQRRTLACLQRLCVENGGQRVQGKAACAALRAALDAQTALVRATKAQLAAAGDAASAAAQHALWVQVQRLLQLKYDAALFLGAGGAEMARAGDLFTELKLRWRVRGADGRVVRLQRPVQCRHSLAAAEVRALVAAHTAARVPGVGAVRTVAARADLLDVALWPAGGARAAPPAPVRVLADRDVLCAPLVRPGPRLANCTVVDLAVTFAPGTWDATVPLRQQTQPQEPLHEEHEEEEQQQEEQQEQEGKRRRRRCRLNAEEVGRLLGPGQRAFVWDGSVYACAPGIADALTALRDTQSDTLARALQDLVAAHTATLVHDATQSKSHHHSRRGRRKAR